MFERNRPIVYCGRSLCTSLKFFMFKVNKLVLGYCGSSIYF